MAARLIASAAFFAALLTVVLAIPADASKTHILKEVFGSAQQQTFVESSGIAVDQSSGDLLVIDRGANKIKRFNPNGTPHSFSALGTNEINGKDGADTTPQNGLSFGGAQEVQIAVDNSGTATDGDIYVTQSSRGVVDVFASTGAYLGQLTGFTQAGAGSFSEPCGVAVDPLGNVYVGDFSSEDLVHKYDPSANPPSNADNVASFSSLAGESSPCTLAAGAGSTAGYIFVNRYNGELFKLDDTTGELKYQLPDDSHRTVFVDPGTGHVYSPRLTGSSAEVVEYDASGALEATRVATIKPGFSVDGVAVNGSNGLLYLTIENAVYVAEAPIVTAPEPETTAATNNTGAHATFNGTVNPDGIELSECFFEWGENAKFDQAVPCAETPAEIGAGTSPVAVHADLSGLKPNDVNYRFSLVAKNPEATAYAVGYQQFNTPQAVFAEAASGISPTEATLNGTVNPDGETLSECVFEWGPPKAPGTEVQTFPEAAPCVPGPGGITGTSPVAVHADISGLDVAGKYKYRLKVTYPGGTIIDPSNSALSGGKTLQTAGPTLEAWTEDVTPIEATLKAKVNPEGSATTYRFEWGETSAYGNESEGDVGSDSSEHELTLPLQELKPGTTYHYRVVATSGVATNEGPDQTFTTGERFAPEADCPNQAFRFGYSAPLPECRAYEMVSPIDKNGGDIRNGGDTTGALQRIVRASTDGEKLTYSALTTFGDAPGGVYSSQYLASRGAAGWTTHGISAPRGRTSEGTFTTGGILLNNEFRGFTPDLSTTWIFDYNETPLAPGAIDEGKGTGNLYSRDNGDGSYQALGLIGRAESSIDGFTADLSHVLVTTFNTNGGTQKTYDYSGGELHPIGIQTDGTPLASTAVAGSFVIGAGREDSANLTHVISDDGSRVFWSYGSPGQAIIYMRENPAEEQSALNGSEECIEPAKACTIQVSAGEGEFWAANPEGSKVLYSEGTLFDAKASLELTDVDTQTTRTIAGKVRGVAGASDDLSRVYFVSGEVLAPGAGAGERNLYLDEEGTVSFIAVLSAEDADPGTQGPPTFSAVSPNPVSHSTRVTPDGSHLAFMSNRSLTGYDNTDTATGEATDEVFLYDASAKELTCVSCRRSGARPEGRYLHRPYSILPIPLEDNAAAWLNTYEHSLHGGQALTPDGSRLFFNAFDALVPQDTNGAADVYEWRSQGTAGCEESEGCIDLISSGQSPDASEFLDATADGRDVFFETNSSLLPQDPGLIDIYDARVGGGYPPEPAPPIPCNGDACQSPPAAPNDPTPASAGFKGKGNPVPQKPRRRGCKARKRHAAKHAKQKKANHKKAKSCRRANRGANR